MIGRMVSQTHLKVTLPRYAFVGVSVALVYLVAFACLEQASFLPSLWNSAIAFLAAVIVQYVAQGALTFRRPLNDARQVLRFATTVTIGLVLSSLMVGYVGPLIGLSNFAASLVVVIALPVFNFIVFLLWVFVDKAETTS